MASANSRAGDDTRTVLFVAREPDETLRTFLPIIDRLGERGGLVGRVLFHHSPGPWARDELERRGSEFRDVVLPATGPGIALLPRRLRRTGLGRAADEIGRFWRVKRLARALLDEEHPSAVVVIQDTLLLERFLVREANRRGLPTLVVQWAFNYPQAMYDRLRAIRYGTNGGSEAGRAPSIGRRLAAPVTRHAYRAALAGLGLSFDLAHSYGGGEARLFAVMGEAFKEQYEAQGVRGKRIVVTGHPLHDAAHARAASMGAGVRAAVRARYELPPDEPILLYATQPVLWRHVMTHAELEQNVRAIAAAAGAAPGRPRLVLKLHPRERAEDYAFCAALDPAVRVITRADMADLIAACDVFMSSSSSTVLLAMMMDRPVVTVNFFQVPHFDVFESIGGTLHARTPEAFAEALHLALADGPTRDRLARERRAALARYTRFDGRATERLADLISEAVGGHRRADGRQPTARHG
jgi:glycosyltransferase involved in cell wall biosynthesis